MVFVFRQYGIFWDFYAAFVKGLGSKSVPKPGPTEKCSSITSNFLPRSDPIRSLLVYLGGSSDAASIILHKPCMLFMFYLFLILKRNHISRHIYNLTSWHFVPVDQARSCCGRVPEKSRLLTSYNDLLTKYCTHPYMSRRTAWLHPGLSATAETRGSYFLLLKDKRVQFLGRSWEVVRGWVVKQKKQM